MLLLMKSGLRHPYREFGRATALKPLELDLRNHVHNPDQQVRVWLDSVELGAFDMESGE